MATKETQDRLVETAVRCFADNAEMRVAAENLLAKTLVADSSTEAIRRWDTLDSGHGRSFRRAYLYILLAAVSLFVLATAMRDVGSYRKIYRLLTSSGPAAEPYFEKRISAGLDASQKLLLFGDLSQGSRTARIRALWDSEPDNPAFFAEYAEAHLSEFSTLPPDFLETARRIDPGNAWFTYLAAALESRDAVKKRVQSKMSKAAGEGPEWDLIDPVSLDKGIALLRTARDQPRCENYQIQLLRRRMLLLPKSTPEEHLQSLAYLSSDTSSGLIRLRLLSDAVAAKAWQLGGTGDTTEFNEVLTDWEAFLSKATRGEPGSIIHDLVIRAAALVAIRNLAPAADQLGLTEQQLRLEQIRGRHEQDYEVRKKMPNREDQVKNGSLLTSLTLPMLRRQVKHPPEIAAADLTPGRLQDHELLSRCSAVGVWVLLGCAMGLVSNYRFRSPVLVRRLAKRFAHLIGLQDTLWIAGVGIVIPFIYTMLLNRFTSLGGRDLGIKSTIMLLPASQYAGMLVLMILLPIFVVRWRLGGRAAAFGFSSRISWLAWLAAFCGFAFISVVGWAATRLSEPGLAVACALLGFPVLWLSVVAFRATFSSPPKLLQRSVAASLLAPTYAFAMLLMISAVPFFKAAEQHWFEQDTFSALDPAFPSLTPYEYKVAGQMRKELRETLGDPL